MWESGLTGMGNLLSCKRLRVLWHTAQHAGRVSCVQRVGSSLKIQRPNPNTWWAKLKSSLPMRAHCSHLQTWISGVTSRTNNWTTPGWDSQLLLECTHIFCCICYFQKGEHCCPSSLWSTGACRKSRSWNKPSFIFSADFNFNVLWN